MKIYTLEELQNHCFDDKEIIDVFDKDNLLKSTIIAMFRFNKLNYSNEKILNTIKISGWMEKYHWTWRAHDKFIKELAKVYKNIYQYNNQVSVYMAQDFVYRFGFIVKDTKTNEDKHYNRLLDCDL